MISIATKPQQEHDPIVGITEVKPPAYPDIPYVEDPGYFYYHPVIQRIAGNDAWTLSGTKSKKSKVPIDAWEYVDKFGLLIGARDHTSSYLMPLFKTYQAFQPAIANMRHVPYVYFLDCTRDHLVCLDVEADCDEELKRRFMRLPFIYGEFSLSGKGVHLLFELPDEIYQKYPAAQKKVKMQDKSTSYEVLLYHYMTFTENMLPPPEDPLDISEFYEIFENLCKKQQLSEIKKAVEAELIEPEDIPGYDSIMRRLRYNTINPKNPDQYDSMSNYEYGCVAIIMHRLYKILRSQGGYLLTHQYTDQEIIMLIYYRLQELLPHRPKHDEERDGLPYLLYVIRDVISKNPFNPPQETD